MENKVALIVGGTGSIGAATAVAFARLGTKVIIAGRNNSAAESVLERIAEAGSEGRFIQTDLTDPASVDKLANKAVNTYGT
ncbi:MAG: SDR family NAD(P)-dependent oxidoreductase, partial [Gammaproteobacteria bacterium]|nr:SDR family NAD(P)-dependent oxidoreductase [Gammaproteobacteria bacterium]